MQEIAEASIALLEQGEGGRTDSITGQGCHYRPHIRIGPDGELMGVCFLEGPEIIQPGGEATVVLGLVYAPGVDYSALAVGVRFQILEGPDIVGSGLITGQSKRVA